jgi:acylphosphatase
VKRVHVFVSGRVQGVFFRADAARMARENGLGGFIRNLPDGRVEAAFEGDPDAVDELVAWCQSGPKWAEVDGVESSEEDPRGDQEFRVTH